MENIKYKLLITLCVILIAAALIGIVYIIWYSHDRNAYYYRLNNFAAEAISGDCMYAELPDGTKTHISEYNINRLINILDITERKLLYTGLPKNIIPENTITVTVNDQRITVYQISVDSDTVYVCYNYRSCKRVFMIDDVYHVFSRLNEALSAENNELVE